MKYLYYLVLLSVVVLTSCGPGTPAASPTTPSSPGATRPTPDATPAPSHSVSPEPSAAPVAETPPAKIPAATPTEQTPPASAPGNEQQVAWHGVTIALPPRHRWEDVPTNQESINNAPVLARGRIAFMESEASTPIEAPDGIHFTIVQFSGTLDEWLLREQERAAGTNPVDAQTIQQTTIAGRPAIAYSYSVIGVSQTQTLLVKIDAERLLVIDNSNAENVDYQTAIQTLKFA